METNVLTKQQALVKEIHSAFDTEADALIAMSEGGAQMLSLEEKAERLKKIGFVNCDEIIQLERIKKDKPLYELAQEYRKKYPDLKFITESQVKGLCEKYNLIIRGVSDYIGNVPEQKLFEIEYWLEEIDDADLPDIEFQYRVKVENEKKMRRLIKLKAKYHDRLTSSLIFMDLYLSEDSCCDIYTHKSKRRSPLLMSEIREAFYKIGLSENQFLDKDVDVIKSDNSKLVIAAPESMFKKKPETPQFKDPIVLQPVKGSYLVIAKWGLEANDELLIIPELS
jgi:hypothetical protein